MGASKNPYFDMNQLRCPTIFCRYALGVPRKSVGHLSWPPLTEWPLKIVRHLCVTMKFLEVPG